MKKIFSNLINTGYKSLLFLNRQWRIVNFHEHIESINEAPEFIRIMDENNIAQCVLLGSPGCTIWGGNRGFEGYEENNSEILNIAKKYPTRFIAFPTLNPLDDNNLERLKQYILQGAQGLKLYYGMSGNHSKGPWHVMRLDHPRMEPVFEYCEKEKIPILFHINNQYLGELILLMEKFPQLYINVPHFMFLTGSEEELAKMESLFQKYPNLYTDISFGHQRFLIAGFSHLSKKSELYRDYIIKHRDRFLFGTDVVVTEAKLKFGFPIAENVKVYRDFLEKKEYQEPFTKEYLQGIYLDKETLKIIYEINPSRILSGFQKNRDKILLDLSKELKSQPSYQLGYQADIFFQNAIEKEKIEFKRYPSLFSIFNLVQNNFYYSLIKFIKNIWGVKLLALVDDSLPIGISTRTKKLIHQLTKKGIITQITKFSRIYYDEPYIPHYYVWVAAGPQSISVYSDGHGTSRPVGAGADPSKEKALMKALGEGLERFCLCVYREKNLLFSPYNNRIFKRALNPLSFAGISSRQRQSEERLKIDENSIFGWAKGFSLFSKREILIPAQVIYTGYKYHPLEPVIRQQISTGAATADSFEEALYQGICEVVERDAFIITYLNKLSPPLIDPKIIEDEDFQYFLEMFKRYNFELYLLDITTDIKIPSIMAIIIDRSGIGLAVHLATKTDLDIERAIKGVIFEAWWGRNEFSHLDFSDPLLKEKHKALKIDSTQMKDFEDRCIFWAYPEMISEIEFLYQGPKKEISKEELKKYKNISNKEKLKIVLNLLKEKDIDAYGIDITTPPIKEEGLWITKVICPKLQPLYLNESMKHLSGERLFQVPVILGYRDKPLSEDELNPIPHPFL